MSNQFVYSAAEPVKLGQKLASVQQLYPIVQRGEPGKRPDTVIAFATTARQQDMIVRALNASQPMSEALAAAERELHTAPVQLDDRVPWDRGRRISCPRPRTRPPRPPPRSGSCIQ